MQGVTGKHFLSTKAHEVTGRHTKSQEGTRSHRKSQDVTGSHRKSHEEAFLFQPRRERCSRLESRSRMVSLLREGFSETQQIN